MGESRVHNVVAGDASGSVQVGVVHGGVHVRVGAQPVPPRQLPAAPGVFTGRVAELAALDRAFAEGSSASGSSVVVSAVGGAGGIGKTWLALRWAHERVERFPDGQLFVDLRGFDPAGEPVAAEVAVRGFLEALGVEPGRVPVSPDARAALYRSLVADKRLLVVLDNAASVEQVVPLLPGGRSCAVVVTSRRTLGGLITRHGARHLDLDFLTGEQSRELLVRRLGEERLAAEPAAVDGLVALCRGFPLALGIVAGRAHVDPGVALAELAAELRELGVLALDDDDPTASLPAVLAASYRALSARQRRVFGLLGVAPGPDTGLPAAVAVSGLSAVEAGRVLRALREASLVDRDGRDRFAMHDLIRDFAARRPLPEEVLEAGLRRVVEFYLHTAHAAGRLLSPRRRLPDLPAPVSGVAALPLTDAGAALAWLDAEHVNVVAALRTAVGRGWHDVVWQLARALNTFHVRRGLVHDALLVARAAVEAAARDSVPTARIDANRFLGVACSRLGRHEEAIGHLLVALELAEAHDDPVEAAHTHLVLATTRERAGELSPALAHARRALVLYRAGGSPLQEADAVNTVGWVLARLGEFDGALAHCRAALELHRDHPYPDAEAAVLARLGYIAHRTGRYEEAVAHCRAALELRRGLGRTYEVADTLAELGGVHAALGEHDAARAAWDEALELFEVQGREEEAGRLRARSSG